MLETYLSRLGPGVKTIAGSPAGKWLSRLLGVLFTVGISAYLVYKIILIGWDKVWQSLPHNPWFYILLLAMFFSLPLFQVLIYRTAWKISVKPWDLFLALLNKRVLDKDVLGYSGEMYLYLWARKYVKKPGSEILHVIKDNILLSSAASTLVAVVVLILFFALGRVALPGQWGHLNIIHAAVLAFCLILIVGLVLKFRGRIFFLKRKEVMEIVGLHFCRLLVVQGLQVIQWAVVCPGIPILNWMTLLAAQIIITRIPLLPSRDLIFTGTGIEMSGLIRVSTPAMAGMLLASSVLNKILNLLFFVVVFFSTRRKRLSDKDKTLLLVDGGNEKRGKK